jgi:hypothetical protein
MRFNGREFVVQIEMFMPNSLEIDMEPRIQGVLNAVGTRRS